MAAVTGSLVVELGLNTAKLVTGMKKAERRIGDFSKRAKAMAKVIAKIGVAATAAAAVGLIALAKSTANTGDQIQKMSLRLGMTTEALSELSFVAERSGVKIESLQVGLQRMTRRVSEAAAGTGEAVKALAELGVNVQNIAKMRPEDQFEVIAEALNNVKNQSDKVRLAFKLFDTEGVSLIQTMSEGAKGIRDLRDEAKKMGFSFSQDMANSAAEFNDKLTNLSFTFKGLKTQIGTALLPVMTDLLAEIQSIVQLTVDWAKANRELLTQDIKGFAQGIVDVIREGAERTGAFAASIGAIKKRFLGFIGGTIPLLERLKEQLEENEKEIIFWGKALDNPIFANSAEAIKFMSDQLELSAKKWLATKKAIDFLRPTLKITQYLIKEEKR